LPHSHLVNIVIVFIVLSFNVLNRKYTVSSTCAEKKKKRQHLPNKYLLMLQKSLCTFMLHEWIIPY